jgi:hypothetical protein
VAEERCGDGAEEVRTVTLCHPAARWWQRKVELAFGVWEGGIHSRWLRGDWGVDDGGEVAVAPSRLWAASGVRASRCEGR